MTRRGVFGVLTGGIAAAATSPSKLVSLDEAGFQKLLAAHKGKPLLVNFWATWCEPCRTEMPLLVKLEAKLKPKGLVLATISADEPEEESRARDFLKNAGVQPPAYLKLAKNDEKFINAIDPKWSGALPANFLYDKSGRKANSFIGEVEIKTLEAAIAKLL